MRRLYKFAFPLCFSLVIFFGVVSGASAIKNCGVFVCSEELDSYTRCLKEKEICELENNIEEKQNESKTLSNAIFILNGQITVQQLQIDQSLAEITSLEKELVELTDRIEGLNYSLDKLTSVLVKRVAEHYKRTYTNPILVFFSKTRFAIKLSEFKYLKLAGQQTVEAMERAESQKITYDEQKLLKKQKQDELESKRIQLEGQKNELNSQKKGKEGLLAVTKNSESEYQKLLSDAKARLDALKASQFTGKKRINKGEIIGYMGSTGFSTGAHLHFSSFSMNQDEDACLFGGDQKFCSYKSLYMSRHKDPTGLLSNRELYFAKNSCNGVGSYQKRSIGGGSFEWPMSSPIITQCYGNTPYSSVYPSNFHRGLDLVDSSNKAIRAVDSGEAYFYRGKTSLGNNVRVYHDNGTMTLYAHMQ